MSEVTRYKAIIADADRTIREQASRIEALESCLRQAREAMLGMGYWWHPNATETPELYEFACKQGDKSFSAAEKALAAIDAVLAPVKEEGR